MAGPRARRNYSHKSSAGMQAEHGFYVPPCVFKVVKDAKRVFLEPLAECRQTNTPAQAIEELGSQFVFKLANLLAEGRL